MLRVVILLILGTQVSAQIGTIGGLQVAAQIGTQTPCTHTSECEADECCFIYRMLVSKRFFMPGQGGYCQKYKGEGEACTDLEKDQGYCGCAAGLTCVPDKRRFVAFIPIPGLCKNSTVPSQ